MGIQDYITSYIFPENQSIRLGFVQSRRVRKKKLLYTIGERKRSRFRESLCASSLFQNCKAECTKDILGMECTQIILAVSDEVAPKIFLGVCLVFSRSPTVD